MQKLESQWTKKREFAARWVAAAAGLMVLCCSAHAAAPDVGWGAIVGFIVYGIAGLLALAILGAAAAIGKKTLAFTSLTLFVFLPGGLYYLEWKDHRLYESNQNEVFRLCRETPFRILERNKPAAAIRIRAIYWKDEAYSYRDYVLSSAVSQIERALSNGKPALRIENERTSESPKERRAQFEILIEDISPAPPPKNGREIIHTRISIVDLLDRRVAAYTYLYHTNSGDVCSNTDNHMRGVVFSVLSPIQETERKEEPRSQAGNSLNREIAPTK